MKRLIVSTLITMKFKNLRWLEHVGIFQDKYNAWQL
jgi:hypothetical protein